MALKEKRNRIVDEIKRNEGILRLAPTWVPRSFLMPGGRLKLHPADLYSLGAHRGGIDERWLASTTKADNGPGTPEDEGLSRIILKDGSWEGSILMSEAVELAGGEMIGEREMNIFGGWNVLTKFFDNQGPIPHHMHQMEEHAGRVGRLGKPEAYYFPVQLNFKGNNFPYTFFGLEPGTTKEVIKRCLKSWYDGDNGILYHSKAYKLKPGTGWDVPPGILHAPGSLVTYELQRNSDVFGMFQSLVEGRPVGRELLVKDVPEDKWQDLDYLVDMLDWDLNVDPNFMANRFMEPRPVREIGAMEEEGYIELWVVYKSTYFSAKELTILPGRTAVIKDEAAYGLIMLEGVGSIQGQALETPSLIRFGELTRDEYFVTAEAARQGVVIRNASSVENLVMLKHFGPAPEVSR